MKLYKPIEIAELYGVSVEFVRAACARDEWNHPIPHLDVSSTKRRCPRIRQEAFEQWLREEEAMTGVER